MAFPRGAAAGSGACVTRQSSSIARAVARQASGACARGHGLAGEHEMPRQACRGSESGPGGSPHPPQVPAVDPRDAAAPPRGTTAPPFGGRGAGWGLTAGTWSGLGAGRRRAAARGSCIARQSTRSSRAVPCYACHTCVARHGLVGSAPIVELCMPAAARPVPGTTAPTLRRPPLSPGRRGTAPGDDHPTSGARRYPPGRPSPGQRDATTPPGTDARRNGIAATARSASLPRLPGLPQFHPEDAAKRPKSAFD